MQADHRFEQKRNEHELEFPILESKTGMRLG